jgi:hypothetical protein
MITREEGIGWGEEIELKLLERERERKEERI